MEISSASSAAQAIETQQALTLRKALSPEQSQVIALIESAVIPPSEPSQDSAIMGHVLDTRA